MKCDFRHFLETFVAKKVAPPLTGHEKNSRPHLSKGKKILALPLSEGKKSLDPPKNPRPPAKNLVASLLIMYVLQCKEDCSQYFMQRVRGMSLYDCKS